MRQVRLPKNIYFPGWPSFFLWSALTLFAGCAEENKTTLKVGFIGCLSGKCSDLGTNGRNGVILAIDEINRQGGFLDSKGNNRPIELVVADTRGGTESAIKSFQQLVHQGVIAIIGPMTSQTGVILKPEADASKTVLISPTVSTEQLSGQDDYFFRVYPTAHVTAPALAKHAIDFHKSQRFTIVHSDSNSPFVDSWIEHFSGDIATYGGDVIGIHQIKKDEPTLPLAQRIVSEKPDSVLVLANAFDTGMIVQQFRKLESRVTILGTEWSTTESLVEFSGRGLEGAYFISSIDGNSQDPLYLEFRQKFQERFGREASFASQFGFEALNALVSALRIQPDEKRLKETLRTIGEVKGLQGKLLIDSFGDVQRDIYLKKFVDGNFQTIARWNGQSFEFVIQND